MFLTAADIERLTEKKRFTAQCRALDRMGIRYSRSARGAPLVKPEDIDRKPGLAHRGHRWERLAAVKPLRP